MALVEPCRVAGKVLLLFAPAAPNRLGPGALPGFRVLSRSRPSVCACVMEINFYGPILRGEGLE